MPLSETPSLPTGVGDDAFQRLVAPYRRELLVHCYRILGSVQDAEDLLQETLLAAWRGLDEFEQRASLRTWLYRIATNRCLNSLREQHRRPSTVGMDTKPAPTREAESIWLQPFPDLLLEGLPDQAPVPDARYELKESVALAFVSGLQRLPPHQRAVLVLRDVLGYRTTEVAEMLRAGPASVTSALQRARQALDEAPTRPIGGRLPSSSGQRRLLTEFTDAFEAGDIDRVVALLRDDAWLRMPPEPHEYQGHRAIAGFLESGCFVRAGHTRLVATSANGHPAFAYYLPDSHAGVLHAAGFLVLELEGARIAAMTRFGDLGVLPWFGLPRNRSMHGRTR